MDFKALAQINNRQVQDNKTPEARYWNKFRGVEEQCESNCTYLHFSPTSPYDIAVSCGNHVTIRSGKDGKKLRSLSRFQEHAYSGSFRGDGKLIAGGDAKGSILVADATSKAVLRTFDGHSAAVQSVCWCADGLRIGSASDDKLINFWDLPTGDLVGTRFGHSDYVRTLDASPHSIHSWISGSYDGTVRVWDIRQNLEALQLNHGAPVKSVLYLPAGNLVASAGSHGGLKIWDLRNVSKLLYESTIPRVISCLAIDCTKTRLLAGGTDSLIKVHSLSNYQVVHTIRTTKSVLSLALSADGNQMAIGSTGGLLCIKRNKINSEENDMTEYTHQNGDTAGQIKRNQTPKTAGFNDSVVSLNTVKRKLQPHDYCLKKFRYQEALDKSLDTNSAGIITSTLNELIQRRGLSIALGGRTEATLLPLLSFLSRKITDPRVTEVSVSVAHVLVDMYASELVENEAIRELFCKIRQQVEHEVLFQVGIQKLKGSINSVIAANSVKLNKFDLSELSQPP